LGSSESHEVTGEATPRIALNLYRRRFRVPRRSRLIRASAPEPLDPSRHARHRESLAAPASGATRPRCFSWSGWAWTPLKRPKSSASPCIRPKPRPPRQGSPPKTIGRPAGGPASQGFRHPAVRLRGRRPRHRPDPSHRLSAGFNGPRTALTAPKVRMTLAASRTWHSARHRKGWTSSLFRTTNRHSHPQGAANPPSRSLHEVERPPVANAPQAGCSQQDEVARPRPPISGDIARPAGRWRTWNGRTR
jgi:hypothetical protein